MPERPLLILPQLGPPLRRIPTDNFPREHLRLPSRAEQAQRFLKKFESMLEASVAETPDGTSQENILVLETAGRVEDFRAAANRIPGLIWQAEIDLDEIESDDAFFERPKIGVHFFKDIVSEVGAVESKEIQHSLIQHNLIDDKGYLVEDFLPSDISAAIPVEHKEHAENIIEKVLNKKKRPFAGRMYLSLSNRQALDQVKTLFDAAQRGENPPQLTGPWKNLFSHLHNVRYWDIEDRVRDTGVLDYWQEELDLKRGTASTISFEIELSFSDDTASRNARQSIIEELVADEGGSIVAICLIPEIRFHALKVELPTENIERVLAKDYGSLFTSGVVLFFRPAAQCCSELFPEGTISEIGEIERPDANPVIALFDGVPLANHALLADFLVIDDPDSFTEDYEPNEFQHGTAMASLICHGELDAGEPPLARKIYVRPILKPEDHSNRRERVPNEVFFEDLIERAVRRMFEGDGGEPPSAPTVKIINLSIADPNRVFHHTLGPTARLLDWLSYKYGVLFCVSIGNVLADYNLEMGGEEFKKLKDEDQVKLTFTAINSNRRNRRILFPAEAINVISVGALHDDMSPSFPMGNRVDILPKRMLPSPVSAVGHGFRSSIKPEILFPGGRQLYQYKGDGVYGISDLPKAPGQKVAGAAVNAGEINRILYTRGTSNATALASRSAGLIYDALEQLFYERGDDFPEGNIAPLLKALLVHGASWGDTSEVISSLLELAGHEKKKEIARFLGYGIPDIQKSLECTMNRATAIGFGSIEKDQRHEFRYPLPSSLSGMDIWRRLTITLAWLSPIVADNRKYRRAALAFEPKGLDERIGGGRSEAQWQQVKNGTIQHEIIEGKKVVAYLRGDGDELVIPVQCREDAGSLDIAIPYGIAVSLEVKEEVDIPIYEEVREAIEIPLREQLVDRIV